MKIGILTCHDSHNPGALLQCFSTVRLLRQMGHDPQVIHYAPNLYRNTFWNQLLKKRNLRKPSIFLKWLARERVVRIVRNDLPLSRFVSHREQLSRLKFDAVLLGADIIWNYSEKIARGHESAYFGNFLNTNRLISFAASSGPTTIDIPPPKHAIEGWNRLTACSVRDQNTASIVKAHSNQSPEVICDPAFHFNVASWKSHLFAPSRPYMLIYAFDPLPSAFQQSIRRFTVQNNLQVTSIFYKQPWVRDNRTLINAYQWLDLLANAAYVVTSTFHGCIFSLLFNRQFGLVMSPQIELKSKELIRSFNLHARICSPTSLISVLESSTPHDAWNGLINTQQRVSIHFLKTALETTPS